MATESQAAVSSAAIIVICDPDGPAAAAVHDYLRANGLTAARWVTPRDIDEAEADLRRDSTVYVVVPRLEDLLIPLWSDRLDTSTWRAATNRITIIAAPEAAGSLPQLFDSWHIWRQRQRRSRAIAGLVLSLLAVAVAFMLLALCP